MNFEQGLNNAWTNIATFVPKLVIFLIILLIGWLIAKAVEKAVNAVLEKVGFDRVVERGPVGQAMAKSKYDASDLIAKLLYFTILLITLSVAFGVFGTNPISDLLTGLIAFLPKVAVALVIIIIASAIAKAVKDLIEGMLGGLSYGKVLANIASIFILGIGIIAALNQVDVAVSVTTPILITLLATLGAVIAIGVGGGMIRPMERRWDRWLHTMEQESGNIRQNARPASEVARERKQQLQNQYGDQPTGQPVSTYAAPASGSGATAAGYDAGTAQQTTYPTEQYPTDQPGPEYR